MAVPEHSTATSLEARVINAFNTLKKEGDRKHQISLFLLFFKDVQNILFVARKTDRNAWNP
jgi:hypothetical protein